MPSIGGTVRTRKKVKVGKQLRETKQDLEADRLAVIRKLAQE